MLTHLFFNSNPPASAQGTRSYTIHNRIVIVRMCDCSVFYVVCLVHVKVKGENGAGTYGTIQNSAIHRTSRRSNHDLNVIHVIMIAGKEMTFI